VVITKKITLNLFQKITPLMALKLSEYFGTTSQFWMNLQNAYDLHKTYEKEKDTFSCIKSHIA
jgi:addiction module HigA family antidote